MLLAAMLLMAAINMSPKIRTGIGDLFIPWAMPGPARFQLANTIPADQRQRFPTENLSFYSQFNGDDQKNKGLRVKIKHLFYRFNTDHQNKKGLCLKIRHFPLSI